MSTPEELYLAMAATGGLYCQLPRSESVAKWLLHKARRKLLTLVHSQAPGELATYGLTIVQTYILMEIFAFVSGDKRILLLLEVFHAQAVQAFYAYIGDPSVAAGLSTNKRLLVHAMHLLETYRVLLLQQPTMMHNTAILGDIVLSRAEAPIPPLLLGITSSGLPDVRINSSQQSTESLCALSILASHHRRLPGSLPRQLKSHHDLIKTVARDWRQEFVELALQKWLTLHSSPPNADTMLLYHLCHLNMYCHFAEMERTARATKETVDPETEDSSSDRASGQSRPSGFNCLRWKPNELQRCFTATEDIDKAAWHATRIHQIAPTIQVYSSPFGERVHLGHEVDTTSSGESIHYSFAIYFSSLVLWSLNFLSRHHQEQDISNAANAALRRGVVLVSRSALPAAKVFKQTLKALQEL